MRRASALLLVALVACSSGSSRPAVSAPPVTLACRDSIATPSQPDAGLTAVLGVVALPTTGTALQTAPSGEPTGRLFAKAGLVVRAGSALDLVVPAGVGLLIGWGNPAPRTSHLVVASCPGAGWLAFAGGYWVDHPACASLLVRVGGHQQRVSIGVGAACPGERPPAQPTSS